MLGLDQEPLLQANLELPLHQPHLRAGRHDSPVTSGPVSQALEKPESGRNSEAGEAQSRWQPQAAQSVLPLG